MSHIQHKTHAKKVARVYVLTISDTRTEETDEGGKLARDLLRAAGHEVVGFGILRDDPALVRARVLELAAQGQVDALVSTGEPASRPAIRPTRRWPHCSASGWTDLASCFGCCRIRRLARRRCSRARWLVRDSTLVLFALPGSPAAVRLGLEKLIVPELSHLRFEAHR